MMNLKQISLGVALLPAAMAIGQDVKVTATADSVDVMQGMLRSVNVEVVQPQGLDLRWLTDATEHTEAVEVAPGVEVNGSSAVDTTDLGNGRLQLNRTLLIQPWNSGEVFIEGIALVDNADNADTFRSNPLAFKVYTAEVDTMTTIHGLQSPVSLKRGFFDWVPDWIADYWWIYLAVLVLIAAAVYGYLRYRRSLNPLSDVSVAKPVPPYDKAMQELEVLRTRNLCEKGEEKTYYTELTEILRQYLEGRFGINAMEMTTPQIKRAVRASVPAEAASGLMAEVLEMADYVKFAKMRPLPEDNTRAFQQALHFVENTKPADEPQKEEQK